MSKLRGIKPTAVQKRLKAFFYGEAGAGKTTAAIQFPAPYLIETEKGAENDQYVKLLNEKGGAIFHTLDFDDLMTEVKALLTEKHPYKTLVIDPLTNLYNNLLEKAEKKVGSEFGRHYGEANKEMKKLMQLLVRLDMNVIITSHAKKEYGDNMSVIGNTFDCYKKLDYLFDLVIEIQKRGKNRVGIIKKTRIEAFGDLEKFPFSYEEMAKRYGIEVLEKSAEQQELATPEQIAEINHYVQLLAVPQEQIEKWLVKAESSSLDELPKDIAQKMIDFFVEKIKKTA